MNEQLNNILKKCKKEIQIMNDLNKLNLLKSKYLGKNSELNKIFKEIYSSFKTNNIQKIKIGKLANKIKQKIIILFKNKKEKLITNKINLNLLNEKIDVTLPGYNLNIGSYHPLNLVINEIINIFEELGYNLVFSSEIEEEEYNFKKLNISINHPSRDIQDTFYFSNKMLLRTHCTNIIPRILCNIQQNNINIAIISFGNVYRRDDNNNIHLPQFTQIDGFVIAPNINFANLKWTLEYVCKKIFDKNISMRIRPSFFPFTEPSVEIDIICIFCNQKGCDFCQYNGWIEILGAGIIHPSVFKACKKSENLTGFAFGMGVERIAMIKYKINNINYFYINDIRFLSQFKNF